MEFRRISSGDISELIRLHIAYKAEIGEDAPTDEQLSVLREAITGQRISFFGCEQDNRLVACCSVSVLFSTFDYAAGGVLEDLYIIPEYRHRGIARKLVRFAFDESGVSSLTVGCADCDLPLYRAIGFRIPLGNMLAFDSRYGHTTGGHDHEQ